MYRLRFHKASYEESKQHDKTTTDSWLFPNRQHLDTAVLVGVTS
ncbi:MAG: hypothetical protein ACTHWQ_07030 [Sphingobacterium sp.]